MLPAAGFLPGWTRWKTGAEGGNCSSGCSIHSHSKCPSRESTRPGPRFQSRGQETSPNNANKLVRTVIPVLFRGLDYWYREWRAQKKR